MNIQWVVLTIATAAGAARAGDTAVKELPELRDELLSMAEVDQSARRALRPGDPESIARLTEIDARNTARMKEIVRQHGWPGKSLVGERGAQSAWLLVQHADRDPAFQKSCLPLLEAAVKKGEAQGQHLAYLTDRILVAEGRPQRYGTQFHPVDGKLVPRPIEDPKNVDARRKAVGLGTLAEYEQQMSRAHPQPAPKK